VLATDVTRTVENAKEVRTTDNTMSKRTRTKGQIIIYKLLHRKQKIKQHEPR